MCGTGQRADRMSYTHALNRRGCPGVWLFMPGSHDPQQNRLLAAMSPGERGRLYPHLRLVPMPLGRFCTSPAMSWPRLLPTDCIVSLLYVLADGASAEISVS